MSARELHVHIRQVVLDASVIGSQHDAGLPSASLHDAITAAIRQHGLVPDPSAGRPAPAATAASALAGALWSHPAVAQACAQPAAGTKPARGRHGAV
jgi:hypothetical protein